MTKPKPHLSFTSIYDEHRALQKLISGGSFGVFIDDTGSPGMANTPAKLHPDRKTWVAVVVAPTEIRAVTTALNEAIEALRGDVALNEFHFVQIFSGKGPLRAVPIEERLVIFQLFADIFYVHELPIYVQTFDPETHAEAITGWPELPKIASCFDLQCHGDAALWFLLVRVRDYILARRRDNGQRAMVFVDEGLKKSGACVEVDVLDDVFLDGQLLFASSSTVSLVQLADFAAFCLNRSQLIIRKDKRSDLEIALLRIMEPLVAQYKNCTPNLGRPDSHGPMIP